MGEFRKPPHLPADDRQLRELVTGLATRIAELEEAWRATGHRGLMLSFSDEKLAVIATWFYSERIYRSGQFNPALFGEPAWDMLLDLFIQTVNGRRVSTTSLCLGANVPQTTGLRYIALLEEEGLVFRDTPPDDKRLSVVGLTPDGSKRMRQYLSLAMTRFRGPLPD